MDTPKDKETGGRTRLSPKIWWRLSIYRKFLLTLLAVGLLPAAAGVALTATELWKVIRGSSGDTLQRGARNIAAQLDHGVKLFIDQADREVAARSDLKNLFTDPNAALTSSALPTLHSSIWQDPNTTRPVLWQDPNTSHPVYVLPFDNPLRVFVLAPYGAEVVSLDPQPYRFLETRSRFMSRGLKSVGVHSDDAVGRHVALVWLPVFGESADESLGWIGIEIPVDRILRAEISRGLFDADEASVITSSRHLLGLFDVDAPSTITAGGQVLRQRRLNRAAQEERAALLYEQLVRFGVGEEDRFAVDFPDGTKQLVGFSPLPLTRVLRTLGLRTYGPTEADWYICIARDMQPLLNRFFAQLSLDLLAGIGLVVVLAGLAYMFARRLTRPIQELEKGVKRLADGDLASRVDIETGDELQHLARSFNEMAHRLEESTRDLQRQMATVRRQTGELALVHDITRSINARLDLEQTLATFAREIARILSYDRISVALLDDPEHFTIQFVFPETEVSEYAAGTRHRIDESDLAEAVSAAGPIVHRDIDRTSSFPVHAFLASGGQRSVMVVPLISESRAIGAVNLASRDPKAFGPEEQKRMAVLAEPVAVAIQHSRLYMRVRRFADELEDEVRRRTNQLRLAQDKLVQTEKLAAAGQLAAGIAHEINNPLGIIKNYLRLTMDRLDRHLADEDIPLEMQHLHIIEEELNRIARIVRNLLDLYHPREHTPVPTDVNHLLDRILELFEPNWAKRGIDIIRKFDPSLPPAIVSSDRIRQIFINLLRNAEDAIKDSGMVALTTRFEAASDEESDQIFVEVEDSGCGISAEALGRVFDPFFTTKKGGAGTGLGLSVTYGIIRSYGGTIDIDSEPGRGTRISVRLPVPAAGAETPETPPPAESPAPAE